MNEQVENFAELLEASMKTLNTGDIVEGTVTSVSQNEIHLDLGAKTTGVIVHDKATLDPQAKLADLYKVGDVVKAKVVKVSDIDGIVKIVRFEGWQNVPTGRKMISRNLRDVIMRKYRIKDKEVFDKAYGYVEQYY